MHTQNNKFENHETQFQRTILVSTSLVISSVLVCVGVGFRDTRIRLLFVPAASNRNLLFARGRLRAFRNGPVGHTSSNRAMQKDSLLRCCHLGVWWIAFAARTAFHHILCESRHRPLVANLLCRAFEPFRAIVSGRPP